MNLGATIKRIRSHKEIRQHVLAENAGISQTYLSQIENNAAEPNLSTLKVLSEKLETPLPILFFLSLDRMDIKPEKRLAYDIIEPSLKTMVVEFFGKEMVGI